VRVERSLTLGYVIAGLGQLAVVSVLTPLREWPEATAIVVLALIVGIAAAAVSAGPLAGAVATMTGALSFDFLFIPPYRDLKLGSDDRLWFVGVLLAVGTAIVTITRRRWPHTAGETRPSAGSRPNSSEHVQRVSLLIEQGADVRDLVSAVEAELLGLLLARRCRFEAATEVSTRPRLERDGTVSGRGLEDSLPAAELELPVRAARQVVGRFVVDPTPGAVVPLDRRIVAVILTDHLAAAITGRSPSVPPRI
jgi:K+-sensing histidine kinase KdpD